MFEHNDGRLYFVSTFLNGFEVLQRLERDHMKKKKKKRLPNVVREFALFGMLRGLE